MNNRAYSVLEIKAVDEKSRTIEGVATTPAVDRVGDIIEPLGVKYDNPMPFLWQHFHDEPIGTVNFEPPTKNGVKFTAKLPLIEEAGNLKDRIDEAWQSIKAGLVRAVSIGFRPLEFAFMENGGIRYNEVEVYELSAVTIPANSEALITSIKAVDAALRRAAGVPDPIPELPPFAQNKLMLNSVPIAAITKGEKVTFGPSEIPEAPTEAVPGKKAVVVKLDDTARDRAPFVINKIHTERKP